MGLAGGPGQPTAIVQTVRPPKRWKMFRTLSTHTWAKSPAVVSQVCAPRRRGVTPAGPGEKACSEQQPAAFGELVPHCALCAHLLPRRRPLRPPLGNLLRVPDPIPFLPSKRTPLSKPSLELPYAVQDFRITVKNVSPVQTLGKCVSRNSRHSTRIRPAPEVRSKVLLSRVPSNVIFKIFKEI